MPMEQAVPVAAPAAAADTPAHGAEMRTLVAIASPIAAGFFAELAMNFTDTLIIGRNVGSLALGAVGLSANLLFSMIFVCTAVISMVGAFAAQARGAGDRKAISHTVRQGFWVATLLSVPATVLGLNLAPVLAWLDQDPAVVAFADQYLGGVAWCFLPYMWFTVLRNFVTALARSTSVMVITAAAIGLNFALVYPLVTGRFGLPALGVAGAGIGTSIVCWVMFAALALHVARSRAFREYRIFHDLLRLDLALCGRILRFGLPAAGTSAAETGLFVAVQLLMGYVGVIALAANQVAYTFQGMAFMFPAAMKEAATARVGFAFGRGSMPSARRSGLVAIGLSVGYMAVIAVVLWTFPETIASLFLGAGDPDATQVLPLAATLLSIGAFFQIVDGIQITAMGALRGINDTVVPFWLGLIGYWGIGLTSGVVLAFALDHGAVGLWWGLALGLAASAMLLAWRFHGRSRALIARPPVRLPA